MKTKHLFLATALVASFASCTNDDIVEMQQGVANANRPTVDNVQLNFVDGGVDSRLTFNGKYAWEATDTIGALLMDQPTDYAGVEGQKWTAQYELSKWVNTSYPFTYNVENKTWSTLGKMLEGNYFFAFPWSSYDGARSVKYAFSHQEQNGIGTSVVAENYAKNQLFIGYAQIKKGVGFDVLTDVEMTNVLGAIQLRIKNTGDKTMHINRILLSNTSLAKYVTFNPTSANYDGEGNTTRDFNITGTTKFNFANYVGNEEAEEYNLEADFVEEYDRMEALRAVVNVNPVAENTGFVQLSIKGEDNVLAPGETAYALIMTNEFSASLTEVTVKIYADEGMSEFDLANTNYKNATVSKTGVITVAPGVSNTIVATVDSDNLVASDESEMEIYSEEDLVQLLAWNAGVTAKETVITATLKTDIEFTKDMFEALKANKNLILNIVNPTPASSDESDSDKEVAPAAETATEAYTLTLAEDLPADALNYEGLDIDVDVAFEGVVTLAKETIDMPSIQALEGATLNINVVNANVPAIVTIDEDATLNIGAAAKVSNTVVINNHGAAEIAAGALVQGEFNNYSTLALNGTANKLVNAADAVVTMGENATINAGSNAAATPKKDAGIIYTASGVTIASNFTNNGEIQYVAGADIKCAGARFVEIADATLEEATYKEEGVNIFVLIGGTVKIDETLSLATIKVKEGAVATITVDDTEDADGNVPVLTIGSLIIQKKAALTTNGKINVGTTSAEGSIKIEKDGEWTNNSAVALYGGFTSEGYTYNNGSVVPKTASSTNAAPGTWKGNAYGAYDDSADKAQAYYTNAMTDIWNDLADAYKNAETTVENLYAYNPTDIEKFASTLVTYYDGATEDKWSNVKKLIEEKLYPADADGATTALTTWKELNGEEKAKDLKKKLNTENFNAAVSAVVYNVTDAKQKTALKEEFIKDSKFKTDAAALVGQNKQVFKTEADAYKTLLAKFAEPETKSAEDFKKYANVWNVISTDDVKNALNATEDGKAVRFGDVEGKYVFVWDGCDLDAVVDVMVTLDAGTWASVLGFTAESFTDADGERVKQENFYTLKGVQAFLKAAYTTTSTAAAATAAKTVAGTYYLACKDWQYSDDQVKNCVTNEGGN